MKFFSLKILTLNLVFLLACRPVSALCSSLSLSNVSPYVSLNMNNFASLNFQVNKEGGTCNSFFVVIDNGGAASFSNRNLQSSLHTYPIQFYKDPGRNQILKSEFEAAPSDVILGTFAGSATTFNANYFAYLGVDDNQYAGSGNYSKNFTLKLYEGDFTNRILRDSKVVQFTYTQYKTIDLSLVSTGSSFNLTDTSQSLDFGKLIEGASRSFDIVMLYNAGYTISMSSTNSGKLKNQSVKKYIPYILTLDGVPVALSDVSTNVKSGGGISQSNGTRIAVGVKIGSLMGSVPGTYTDTVTINVASAE